MTVRERRRRDARDRRVVRWVLVAIVLVATGVVAVLDPAGWLDRTCTSIGDPVATTPAVGDTRMVVAAHPDAAAAGCRVLADGGSAVDAAIAAQLVLGVVEPQSSGLGGGSIALVHDATTDTTRVLDGLARSPAGTDDDLDTPTAADRAALDVDDELPRGVERTGRAVGVPGTPALLGRLHREGGRLPWPALFTEAIALARDGSEATPYLDDVLDADVGGRERCDWPDLAAWCADAEAVVQPELADVLVELRDGGAGAFYDPDGSIAPAVVERVQAGPPRTEGERPVVLPGLLTTDDLAGYRAVERPLRCTDALEHRVCGPAAPSSGGVTVLAVLELLERADVAATEPGSRERVHLAIEASRLVQVDRREYVGDPDVRAVDDDALLDPGYLDRRAALLSSSGAVPEPEPGDPPGPAAPGVAPGPASNGGGDVENTTHVSVVDGDGNAVSMTSSVNAEFGAHVVARGIVLNDVLANFTARDSISRGQRVNQAEPAKRPRTTMAPTMAFDAVGRLDAVVGSAGGSGIPDHVTQALLGMLVDELDPAAALAAGHWSGQGITSDCDGDIGPLSQVEDDSELVDLVDDLDDLGHPCARRGRLRSGTSAIRVLDDGTLSGAADPRRDGRAIGD